MSGSRPVGAILTVGEAIRPTVAHAFGASEVECLLQAQVDAGEIPQDLDERAIHELWSVWVIAGMDQIEGNFLLISSSRAARAPAPTV